MADYDYKVCRVCGESKPITSFYKAKENKDGRNNACATCYCQRIKNDRKVNPEKYRKVAEKYKSKPDYKSIKKQWVLKNPEKRQEILRKYHKKHYAKLHEKVLARLALKKQAIPLWYDKKLCQMFYKLSQEKTKHTGVRHEVDHIVPLKSNIVCGLHCQQNLQVITEYENRSKSNKTWPDMP